jgi:hypothetical protein
MPVETEIAKVAIALDRGIRQILITTALKPMVAIPRNPNWITATRTEMTFAVFHEESFGKSVATLYCASEQG